MVYVGNFIVINLNYLLIFNTCSCTLSCKNTNLSWDGYLCNDKNLTIQLKKNTNEDCLKSDECNRIQRLFCSIDTRKCIKCPNRWIFDSGYCYFVSNNKLSWTQSNRWCQSYSSYLINFFQNSTTSYTYFTQKNDDEFWIGLYKNDNTWLWTRNNQVFHDTENWWQKGEDNQRSNCAFIGSNDKIYSKNCKRLLKFACLKYL